MKLSWTRVLHQETQLVLLLPQLTFAISVKNGKNYSFFLSSEHEKIQWTQSIRVLQQTLPASQSDTAVNLNELQAWIETCRKGLNPNLGSFLLRSTKDEDLLHGDLYIEILSLQRLSRPAGKLSYPQSNDHCVKMIQQLLTSFSLSPFFLSLLR